MEIDRVKKLSRQSFLDNYLIKNKPVVVTDAMDYWDMKRFHPHSLTKEFGAEDTQIYNDLFDFQNIDTLESYINSNFNRPEETCKDYIRWYTKLKDMDFLWSDHIFDKLKSAWSQPYFVPTSALIIPFCEKEKVIDVTTARFPYKGLFVSGKGARTRLHKDPFNSNAILCQVYGEKEVHLYSPEQEVYLMNGREFVNIVHPDLAKFPGFHKARADYHFTLTPGEIVFFPAGWFHDVTCVSDSISITWNFVHFSELRRFQDFILQNPNDDQLEIARFFLKEYISADASVHDISSLLQRKIGQSEKDYHVA